MSSYLWVRTLTLYSLRHTFASQLLDQGVKPEVVAKLLGHENVATTYQFYAHAIPANDTLSIDRLTIARQAAGDLNGDLSRQRVRKPNKNVVSRLGIEPRTP